MEDSAVHARTRAYAVGQRKWRILACSVREGAGKTQEEEEGVNWSSNAACQIRRSRAFVCVRVFFVFFVLRLCWCVSVCVCVYCYLQGRYKGPTGEEGGGRERTSTSIKGVGNRVEVAEKDRACCTLRRTAAWCHLEKGAVQQYRSAAYAKVATRCGPQNKEAKDADRRTHLTQASTPHRRPTAVQQCRRKMQVTAASRGRESPQAAESPMHTLHHPIHR